MCGSDHEKNSSAGIKTIPVTEAIGTVLAHDITEIRQNEFKGRAFKKGHIVTKEDICHLQRLGKERLFVIKIAEDEMHEDDAAYALASSLMGQSVVIEGEPKEGKINLIAQRDGLLKIRKDALLRFNMLGEVMCATLHDNTVVKKGQIVAGARAIPLVIRKSVVEEAVRICENIGSRSSLSLRGASTKQSRRKDCRAPLAMTNCDVRRSGVISVKEIRKPKAGVVITGNEVYYGRIQDAFAPVITEKIKAFGGELVGIYHAPDDEGFIEARMGELIEAGADLLITTGGMSVDPDDVTRFAVRKVGATEITYGSSVLPGSMFLVAYIEQESEVRSQKSEVKNSELETQNSKLIPILGIPACAIYHKTTIFDLILPRVLAGEKIGRKELAELGHGGLCLNCGDCRYPVCPFGK